MRVLNETPDKNLTMTHRKDKNDYGQSYGHTD